MNTVKNETIIEFEEKKSKFIGYFNGIKLFVTSKSFEKWYGWKAEEVWLTNERWKKNKANTIAIATVINDNKSIIYLLFFIFIF